MGSSKAPSVAAPVMAEQMVTPATAKEISRETESMNRNSAEKRARLRGIRSTYTRYADEQGGGASKLG